MRDVDPACGPLDAPRNRQTIFVGPLPANNGNSVALRKSLENFPREWARARIRVTIRFMLNNPVPTLGSIFIRPLRKPRQIESSGQIALPGPAQTIATFGQIATNDTDNFAQEFSVEVEGMQGLMIDNRTDASYDTCEVDFDVIARPVDNVGP